MSARMRVIPRRNESAGAEYELGWEATQPPHQQPLALRGQGALAGLDGVDVLREERRRDRQAADFHLGSEAHALELAPQDALHRGLTLLRLPQAPQKLAGDQVAPMQICRHRVEACIVGVALL